MVPQRKLGTAGIFEWVLFRVPVLLFDTREYIYIHRLRESLYFWRTMLVSIGFAQVSEYELMTFFNFCNLSFDSFAFDVISYINN